MNGPKLVASDNRLTIGLITGQLHARVFEDQWQGVLAAAKKMNVNLIIYPGSALKSPYGFEKQGNLLYETVVQPKFFDGLIIWTGALDWFVTEAELMVFIQRFVDVPLVSMETPVVGVPTITIGNYQGMWDLVQHLLVVHGYRRLALVMGPEGHQGIHNRYQAYYDCLASHDVPFDSELVVNGDFSVKSGQTAVSILIDDRQKDFDVIVAANDKMALGALTELQARGYLVPTHKAVVGFDDDQVTSPPLTTALPSFFEMGRLALETCVSLVKGQPVPEFIEIPAELMVRRSCGCLPQALEKLAHQTLSELKDATIHQYIVTAVVESIPIHPSTRVLESLAQAFEHSILENKKEIFLTSLDENLLREVASGGDLKLWHEVISVFRMASKSWLHFPQHISLAEDFCRQAQLLIQDTRNWIYEYQFVVAAQKARTLREISDSLITAFGFEELIDLTVEMFPQIGVNQGAVAIYQEEGEAPTLCELLVVYDENGRYPLRTNSVWVFQESVLPSQLLNCENRQTFIVAPLYFREEDLGVVVFGIGTQDGTVYESLRSQLSSAVKRSLMVREIQFSQSELEARVLERTSELSQEVLLHKKTADALQKSEATTRAFLEAIPDAIFLVDEEARFLNFMPMEGMKTAVSLDDYLGLTLEAVFPPKLAQNLASAISDSTRMESVLLQEYGIEIGNVNRYYEARLLTMGRGNVLGIIRDITERKQNETEREQLISELETKNAELERFTYTVSHDLKSPLVTIQGFVGFLESDIAQQKWENVPGDLDHIKQASVKMQTLLQDLLNLSRLGRVINPAEIITFGEIVRDALLNVKFQYEERGIQIIIPAQMPVVSVDRMRMVEVMQNLLENAGKFMGEQPTPVVEIGVIQRDKDYLFFVKDNGLGLDARYHDKAFDLFERIHQEIDGTGVGLAVVKRIVELHGGQIWVESLGKGLGSTFFFTLPLPSQANDE